MAVPTDAIERYEVPISLYLGMPQGAHADLTTVSRIGLSFTAVIAEIAQELYPDADVRIEAVDATEGSFGWNTLTKIYLDAKAGILAGARKHPRAGFLTAYVALRILNNSVDWSQDQVMDWMSGKDAPAEVRAMNASDRSAIAIDIVNKLKQGVAEQPADAIFREAKRDGVVESVGVTSYRGKRPDVVVHRPSFIVNRTPTATDETHRTRSRIIAATLISPVLAPGERRWKFKTAAGEFGAPIKDAEFIENVLTGKIDIRLKAGLVLDVQLETTEIFDDGAWQIESRTVTKVYGWHDEPVQGELAGLRTGNIQEGQQADQ
jgi:hypothetical protein